MLNFWLLLRVFGTFDSEGHPTVLAGSFGPTLGFALLLRAWRGLLFSVSRGTMRVGFFKGLIILKTWMAEKI